MIRGVYFDAGNTLIFPDYGIYRDVAGRLGAAIGVDDAVAAEAHARSAFDEAVASSSGRDVMSFWDIYYTPFYRHLGLAEESIPAAIELTRDANDEGLGIWKVPVEGYRDTIGALRERVDVIGIVSNSDGRLDDRLRGIGIRDDFDFVIDSAVVGTSKPDVAIFRAALDLGGLSPEEVVYVGDYYAVDVVGARGAGIRPVLFDPVGAYGPVDCDIMTTFPEIVGLVDAWREGA
ncbi:MAG: HAD-IA family hydrolase [Candidatus Eisenbacteria bacterium]|nr:HAD-IA family hydrolase [Candidatus Eisenbacteria bacterium]